MRLISLQPSTTLILHALGKLDHLVAHTRYCREALPDLTLPGTLLPGVLVEDAWSTAEKDIAALCALHPDLILASIPYRLESLAAILQSGLPVLTLAPHTLADIANDIRLVSSIVHADPTPILTRFTQTIAETRQRTWSLPKPLVHCEEWGHPIIHSQPWVAELIEAAGGAFLGTPGAHTTPEAIAAANPDVLLFSWCGAGTRVPLARVIAERHWQTLPAVQNRRVFCIRDSLLNTPAPNLLEGLAALAWCLHPETFQSIQQLNVVQL